MRCHTNVGARFHSRTEVPDSGRARLSDEGLGNCNLSSNGYLSLRASWRSFGEGVADRELSLDSRYIMSEIECRKWRYRIENPPSLMHIPEPLLKCVGFLADEMPDASGIEYDPFATGFFVVIPSSQSAGGFLCFVTAKHNFYDDQGGIKTPT